MAADDSKPFLIQMWTSLVQSIFSFQMDAKANKQARVSAAFHFIREYFFRHSTTCNSEPGTSVSNRSRPKHSSMFSFWLGAAFLIALLYSSGYSFKKLAVEQEQS